MIPKDELLPLLGRNIRRLREAKGMSQQDLAERVDVDRKTINRLENAQRSPRSELLYAIADTLEVSTDELRKMTEPLAIPA